MNVIRKATERLSRGKVYRRTLPSEYGGRAFYVSPESALRYLRPGTGWVDRPLLDIAQEFVKPGSVVWDVGANVGMFSFAASGLAGGSGSIFAIEPDAYLVGLLRRSSHLEAADSAKVTVVPCGVSSELSLATFNIAESGRAANFLLGHDAGHIVGVRESQSILTITLDWLVTQIPPPDLIKIDAEGADLKVLEGASALLREKRPVLICEVYAANADRVTSILLDLGYTIFNAELSRDTRSPLHRATYNTLAVPN